MSDAIVVAIIISVPSSIAGIGSLIASIMALRKSQETAIAVDGKMAQLLAVSKSEANLQGRSDLALEQAASSVLTVEPVIATIESRGKK